MGKLSIFLALAFAMSGIARADIMVVLNSGPVVSGPNFKWSYTVTVKSGYTLNTGDFFTIYDIGGFGVGVPLAGNVIVPNANWSTSIQLHGVNGFAQAPADGAGIYNVTYTYTGSAIVAASDTIVGGGAGAFGYTSSNSTSFTGAYSATTHVTAGGAAAGNTSTVTVAGGPYDIIFDNGFE
jgi:hypothetical protein